MQNLKKTKVFVRRDLSSSGSFKAVDSAASLQNSYQSHFSENTLHQLVGSTSWFANRNEEDRL